MRCSACAIGQYFSRQIAIGRLGRTITFSIYFKVYWRFSFTNLPVLLWLNVSLLLIALPQRSGVASSPWWLVMGQKCQCFPPRRVAAPHVVGGNAETDLWQGPSLWIGSMVSPLFSREVFWIPDPALELFTQCPGAVVLPLDSLKL